MIRKYRIHTLHTNIRHYQEDPRNTNSYKISIRQLKISNQLSTPHQDD